MIYLRNNTKHDQWLEDPVTGIRRKVESEELARVSPATAEHVMRNEPEKWVRVDPIPLAAPVEKPPN